MPKLSHVIGSQCVFLPASLVILGKILNKEKCFFYEAKVFLGTWSTRVEKDRDAISTLKRTHHHATPAEEAAQKFHGLALIGTHRLFDHGSKVVKAVWLLHPPQSCSKLLDRFDTWKVVQRWRDTTVTSYIEVFPQTFSMVILCMESSHF